MFLKVLLLLLFPLLASGELKHFRCNSPEEVREMEIKQVFNVKNYTFVLWGNQLIGFKAPFCFSKSKKQTICGIGQAFEVETKFKSGKRANLKFKGFYYTTGDTVVIYENPGGKLEGHLISMMDESKELTEMSKDYIVDQNNFYMFQGQTFTLHFKLSDHTFTISYDLSNPNLLNLAVNKFSNFKKRVDFTLSQLMSYQRYPSGNNTLLVFDTKNSKVHISFLEFGTDPKRPDDIQVHTRPVEFAELFNCIRKMEKPSDLKGMFFSGGTSPQWYIFIKRFFLAIQEDLPVLLTDEHYRGAKEIDFPDDVFFNLDLKKFVRRLDRMST